MSVNHSQEGKRKTTTTTRITKLSIGLLAAVIVLSFVAAAQLAANNNVAYAQTSERRAVTEILPIEETVGSDCESGEAIEISGDVHLVSRVSQDESGGLHVVQHVNFQNVRGESLTTGTTYRVPNAFNLVTNFDVERGGGTQTQTTSFQLVSQGESVQDLLLHAQFHITINANGEVTSEIANVSLECR